MKKKVSLKGRSFYTLLAAFAIVILVLLCAAYAICSIALKKTGEQLQTSLETVLTLQVQNIGESYSSDAYSALEASLGRNAVLRDLAAQKDLENHPALSEARSLLSEYESAVTYGDIACFFYFEKSDFLLGTESDSSMLKEEPDYVTSHLKQLPSMEIGSSEKYLGTDEEDGNYDVCLSKLAPDLGLIRISYGLPSYQLPELFRSGMTGVEMYTYDQYGNTHALEETTELREVYDYFSLGEENADTFLFKNGGHSYIGSYCTFASRPIRLAVFIRDTATENRIIAQRIILIAVLLLGAICLLLAFLFVRWSYRPVDELVSQVENEEAMDGPFRDDYGIISHILEQWEEHLKEQENSQDFPGSSELQALSESISSLSVSEAVERYDAIVRQISRTDPDQMNSRTMLFSLLANTVALSVEDISLPGDISRNTVHSSADRLRGAENAWQLRSELESVLSDLQKVRMPEAEENFGRIRQYVLENYRNPELSASMVAEHFHISQSALSRQFKKYNQTGFLEYVHQLRVAEATRLLKETDKPLSEIAGLCGYTNVYTMNRAFKTYAHVTPGKLREMEETENTENQD